MRKMMAGLALTMALAALGCGGDGDSSVDKFKGVWTYTAGTAIVNCPDLGQTTSMLVPGNVTLSAAAGGNADLLYTDGSGCNFRFAVAGSNAMILAGQTCNQPDANGTLTLMPSSWLLTTTDGTIMNESGSGTGTYLSGGASFPCSFTATGTLTKVGR